MRVPVPRSLYVLALTAVVPALTVSLEAGLIYAGLFALMIVRGLMAAWALLIVGQLYMAVWLVPFIATGRIADALVGFSGLLSLALLYTRPVQRFVEARRSLRPRRPSRPVYVRPDAPR